MALIRHNNRSSSNLIGTNLNATKDTLITATGGTITTDGNFKVHTFTTSTDDFVISSVEGLGLVEYLIIGGGGGGGYQAGGGGGAGGVLQGSAYFTAGTYDITICGGNSGKSSGNQGAGRGSSSSINPTSATGASINGYDKTLTAYGGGGGANGTSDTYYAQWGGSGGGSAGINSNGANSMLAHMAGQSVSDQGTHGGHGGYYNTTFIGGGGGGGADRPGDNFHTGNGPVGNHPQGGTGIQSAITGTLTYYAGGGGGSYASYQSGTGCAGGSGGGGNGADNGISGTAGTANTGGGGGGGAYSVYPNGSNGGSGIVIVRYRFQG